jgi:hypothetical protein
LASAFARPRPDYGATGFRVPREEKTKQQVAEITKVSLFLIFFVAFAAFCLI